MTVRKWLESLGIRSFQLGITVVLKEHARGRGSFTFGVWLLFLLCRPLRRHRRLHRYEDWSSYGLRMAHGTGTGSTSCESRTNLKAEPATRKKLMCLGEDSRINERDNGSGLLLLHSKKASSKQIIYPLTSPDSRPTKKCPRVCQTENFPKDTITPWRDTI